MSTAPRSKPDQGSPQALTSARYAALKRDVQQLTVRADRLTDQAKVEAYWQLGERIAREKLETQRGYQTAVLHDLANDIRIAVRTLHYAVAFRRCYKRTPKHALSWGHYRLLLDRPNDESRAHYQALAIEQALPVNKLAHVIASDARQKSGEGFKRPTQPSYLYGATVENIIDGDTMDLRIDLGFHTDRRGRFRLADINCPELPSAEARAARDFVFNRLSTAQTIVVKTQRTDLHGRYVAHVFYSATKVAIDTCFKEGTYLNAELVEAGHADLVG